MEPEIHFSGVQSIGKRKEQQDDYAFAALGEVNTPYNSLLAVLCDGMGGETNGRLSSTHVVTAIADYVCDHLNATDSSHSILHTALEKANASLKIAKGEDDRDGGTTLVVAWFEKDKLYYLSVGDSHLYLYRNKKITKINADHSMLPILLERARQGEMTEHEALTHRDKNVLCSAVCGYEIEQIDSPTEPLKLQTGDIVLIASDGLNSIEEPEIESILEKYEENTAASIVDVLIEKVEKKNRPKQDNTTVLVVKIS